MYSKIVNPKTGRKVSTKGKLGQSILRNYINLLGGKAGVSKLIFIRDCLPIMDAEWNKGAGTTRWGQSIPWKSLEKIVAFSPKHNWSGLFGDLTIAHFKTEPQSVFLNATLPRAAGIRKNSPWLLQAEQDLKDFIINRGL
tara:strand:+ start:483 stop:902 length:420 start_codon:yes stop_codon:yes gene_type:complete